MSSVKRLDEVSFIRIIAALLICLYHAFTCYNGGWKQPEGYVDILTYKWIARLSFAFSLQAFVFISGYLFAYQRITLKRTAGVALISTKFKRLMLPSVIFSTLYFVLFKEYKGIWNCLYSIINGCGHLWYLPMLFWLFVLAYLLESLQLNDKWKLLIVSFLNLTYTVNLPFPLQLSKASYYFVYFYGGFLCYKESDVIKSHLSFQNLSFAWLFFVVSFVLLRPLSDLLIAHTRIQKLILLVCIRISLLIYVWAGLIALYSTTVYYLQRHSLSQFAQHFALCCFGFYLCQQFVLQLLYYKSRFPVLVGPYWLPWCGFILASAVSYSISTILVKTKIGRYLIG